MGLNMCFLLPNHVVYQLCCIANFSSILVLNFVRCIIQCIRIYLASYAYVYVCMHMNVGLITTIPLFNNCLDSFLAPYFCR